MLTHFSFAFVTLGRSQGARSCRTRKLQSADRGTAARQCARQRPRAKNRVCSRAGGSQWRASRAAHTAHRRPHPAAQHGKPSTAAHWHRRDAVEHAFWRACGDVQRLSAPAGYVPLAHAPLLRQRGAADLGAGLAAAGRRATQVLHPLHPRLLASGSSRH